MYVGIVLMCVDCVLADPGQRTPSRGGCVTLVQVLSSPTPIQEH
jgi:hypothetical protein